MGLRKEFQNLVVDGVNDAAGRGEQGQHVGVPTARVAGVRAGAFGEQQAHRIGVPVLRGQHERRVPILVFGFELGPGFQEGFHAIGVALLRHGRPIVGRHRRQGGERQEEQNRARHHRPNVAKSPAAGGVGRAGEGPRGYPIAPTRGDGSRPPGYESRRTLRRNG